MALVKTRERERILTSCYHKDSTFHSLSLSYFETTDLPTTFHAMRWGKQHEYLVDQQHHPYDHLLQGCKTKLLFLFEEQRSDLRRGKLLHCRACRLTTLEQEVGLEQEEI